MSNKNDDANDEMLDEYDFRGGVRGKYADQFSDECRLVVLDPDIAEVFRDANAVNGALRELIHRRSAGPRKE